MQIFKVGGAVRDRLLGLSSHDNDWVVVGATAEDMTARGYIPVGKDFPVFLHPQSKEEYALARTERKSGHGYKGFQFYTDPSVTLEEDLQRRDLTINAMAEDEQGQLIDPYQGQADLQQRLLRHISPAFAEDPLRVLRVARFAARFHPLGFRVADETLTLMKEISASGELKHLTAERVWQELERALGEAAPEIFFQVLATTEALPHLFPEFVRLFKSTDDAAVHALRQTADNGSEASVRLAVLCYFVDSQVHDLTDFLNRIKAPNAVKTLCQLVHQHADSLLNITDLDPQAQLQLYQQLDIQRRPERLPLLIDACQALVTANSGTTAAAPTTKPDFVQRLQAITDISRRIEPKTLVAEGFKGKALGTELQRRQLAALKRLCAT